MTQPSVVYRTDPLTVADYDDAIRDLTDARDQIASGELWRGCGYCGSEEHHPNACHHNPLVRAKEAVQNLEREHWRCFHCGEVFSRSDEELAREHFGVRGGPVPKCFADELRRAGFVVLTRDDGDEELVLRRIGERQRSTPSIAEGNQL